MTERSQQKTRLNRHEVLSIGYVVPDSIRCVQCGICSYNCPSGIDVRQHSWLSLPISDRQCLTCGECVRRCPRGVLHFEKLPQYKNHTVQE